MVDGEHELQIAFKWALGCPGFWVTRGYGTSVPCWGDLPSSSNATPKNFLLPKIHTRNRLCSQSWGFPQGLQNTPKNTGAIPKQMRFRSMASGNPGCQQWKTEYDLWKDGIQSKWIDCKRLACPSATQSWHAERKPEWIKSVLLDMQNQKDAIPRHMRLWSMGSRMFWKPSLVSK